MSFLYRDARQCHEAFKFKRRLRRGDRMRCFSGIVVRILEISECRCCGACCLASLGNVAASHRLMRRTQGGI
jgi:hypothetical protein